MYSIAIVGATGIVGRTFLAVLEERRFPIGRLSLFASSRSAGQSLLHGGRTLPVEDLERAETRGYDLVLFSAGAAVSRRHAPRFADSGALVVDNSSAFRMEARTPLVVPEVNPEALAGARSRAAGGGIVSVPNCSTIQLVMVLKPLHDLAGLTRVTVATYQSAAGAGQTALLELETETRRQLDGEAPSARVFPHPLAFDVLPQIGPFAADGTTGEEEKMIQETRKILGLPDLRVSVTCVRVPVRVGHSEAVWVETERPLTPEAARAGLEAAPGVQVRDDPGNAVYPLAREAAGTDPVYAGRIRCDPASPRGLILWVVADNVRKGAALNAVQIAERVLLRPAPAAEPPKQDARSRR
jgi:aspartate-semialdehyde dehydrogenase